MSERFISNSESVQRLVSNSNVKSTLKTFGQNDCKPFFWKMMKESVKTLLCRFPRSSLSIRPVLYSFRSFTSIIATGASFVTIRLLPFSTYRFLRCSFIQGYLQWCTQKIFMGGFQSAKIFLCIKIESMIRKNIKQAAIQYVNVVKQL